MTATPFFRILILLSLVITCGSVYASDMAGTWQLHGTLQVDASIKNQHLASKALDNAILVLGTQKHFVIEGSAFQLSGNWMHKSPAFQGSFNITSVNAFLTNMATDLKIKSGLMLKNSANKLVLTGMELADGTIKGEWLIVSKIAFTKYSREMGSLRISYRFTGKRSH